jgi:hypothetical protein
MDDPRVDATLDEARDPLMGATLADARALSMAGVSPHEVQRQYGLVAAYAPDWRDAWDACREAGELAASVEDFGRARRWMTVAEMRLVAVGAPQHIKDSASRLDRLYAEYFHQGRFTPPRKTFETLDPSPRRFRCHRLRIHRRRPSGIGRHPLPSVAGTHAQ